MTAAGRTAPIEAPAKARNQTTCAAIVLRRADFRESSRIVTCLTRDHGRVIGLAKGCHRPDSPFLGRIDFLNELRATFSADRGGLRLLMRAELVDERRQLREPQRFLCASHLANLCDHAAAERPDPPLFDLLLGGLNLIARCPVPTLPTVVLGLELRFLDMSGGLPDLDHCACGEPLADTAWHDATGPGFACRAHAGGERRPVAASAVRLLRTLQRTSGRDWPSLPADVVGRAALSAAAPLPARWLWTALEVRSPWRSWLFER